MPCTFIAETQGKIAQIAVFPDRKGRNVEELGHFVNLLLRYRMLHNHDCIVNVATLDQAIIEKELDFMEENEGAADTDFFCIDNLRIPQCMLNSENA